MLNEPGYQWDGVARAMEARDRERNEYLDRELARLGMAGKSGPQTIQRCARGHYAWGFKRLVKGDHVRLQRYCLTCNRDRERERRARAARLEERRRES